MEEETEVFLSESYSLKSHFNQQAGPIHLYLQRCSCVIIDKVIYCLGGEENKRITANCIEIDMRKDSWWKSDISLQRPKINFCAENLEGKIIVAGGEDENGGFLQECEAIDPQLKKSTCISPLNIARKNFVLLYDQNRGVLFALGGITQEENASKKCEFIDENSNGDWCLMPDMLTGRCYFSALIVYEHIYCFGGRDKDGKIINFVEKFDGSQWVACSPMIKSRMWFVSVFKQDEDTLWCFGGVSDDEEPTDSVEKYSIEQDLWVPARVLKEPRCGFYCVGME